MLDLIGRTPLVRLPHFERETPGVELYAKAEWQNPGGSVKDRAAARMIRRRRSVAARLRPGLTIVDATSGNTGIAYAMVGAARGYQVKLFLPENASPERKLILRAFGAELVLTDPLEGTDGAIREVRRLVAEQPEQYFYPDQYSNDGNWRAHFDTTGPEIIEQTGGRLTHFVAGLGTSGTFMGTGRALAPVQSGDQADFVSARLAVSRPRRAEAHGDGDGAGDLRSDARRRGPCASAPRQRTGWCGGWRARKGCWSASRRAPRWRRRCRWRGGSTQGVVVTVFPDGAEKYLTETFWTADE